MTAQIPLNARREILAAAAATDGSRAALDRVAAEHGLMFRELQGLIVSAQARASRVATPSSSSVVVNTTAPSPQAVTTRMCSSCEVAQPLDNFYPQEKGRAGRMGQCMTCHNRRRPTETRMVRNRARNRAYVALSKVHIQEFAELYDAELEKARAEHTELTRVAASAGQSDAKVARLRRGPKRPGQQTTDRLDVARCEICHTHHDANHECPSCGDTTPEQAPRVKTWEIREWARRHGIDVPDRGPLPERVSAAYADAHEASHERAAQ